MNTAATPGVIRVLERALNGAKAGQIVGVTVISYADDWSWTTTSAGAVLRLPSVGIAAAHLMASQFERRVRAIAPRTDRRA